LAASVTAASDAADDSVDLVALAVIEDLAAEDISREF